MLKKYYNKDLSTRIAVFVSVHSSYHWTTMNIYASTEEFGLWFCNSKPISLHWCRDQLVETLEQIVDQNKEQNAWKTSPFNWK